VAVFKTPLMHRPRVYVGRAKSLARLLCPRIPELGSLVRARAFSVRDVSAPEPCGMRNGGIFAGCRRHRWPSFTLRQRRSASAASSNHTISHREGGTGLLEHPRARIAIFRIISVSHCFINAQTLRPPGLSFVPFARIIVTQVSKQRFPPCSIH